MRGMRTYKIYEFAVHRLHVCTEPRILSNYQVLFGKFNRAAIRTIGMLIREFTVLLCCADLFRDKP